MMLMLLIFLTCRCVLSAKDDTDRELTGVETVITSDTLLFDYQQRMCVFEGNVIVKDPRVRIESQKLHVFFDASNQVESVVATEAVKVTQADRKATCGRAVYTASNGAIVMTQNPKLVRSRDTLQGEEIRIFVNTEKATSTPARLELFPSDSRGIPGGQKK